MQLQKIAEQVYFDNPRLNSKSGLRDAINIATGNELDPTQVDIVFDMVIERVKNPKIGEILQIDSQRKGKFIIQLTAIDDEWLTGTIILGETKAMIENNKKYEGESVTCRRELCYFYPVKPGNLVAA